MPLNRLIAAAILGMVTLTACGTDTTGTAQSAPTTTTTTTTTATTTTTTEAPEPEAVTEVVDSVTVVTSTGAEIVLTGLAAPAQCWGAAAHEFAKATLTGAEVLVDAGALTLPDGADFAVLAVSKGMAKAGTTASSAITAAQSTARSASLGLWGAPCNGLDVLPAPAPAPVPAPAPAPAPTTTKAPVVKAAPVPAPAPEPTTEEQAAAYYKNCSAAKAAGAAPLHVGEPGYRPALDRDGDGVACE